ncbi:MAG: hypothetical protein LBE91_21245 [Tannerella sp.]|jgi:uncharacterized protein involved in exopolysaccharide biosynthesis|nr:hypothetical protein [Tannerella sp.]
MSTENKIQRNEFEYLKETALFLLKYWYYFVITMIISVIIAFIYIKTKKPVLSVLSTVSLRHDESLLSGASLGKSQSVLSAFGLGGGAENIEDESLKMQSQGYVKKVIKELGLNTEYKQMQLWGLNKKKLYDKSPVLVSAGGAMADTLTPVIVFKVNLKDDVTKIKMKVGRRTIGRYEIQSFPSEIETPLGKFVFSKSEYFDLYKKPVNLDILYSSYDFMAQIYRKIIEVDFEKKSSDLIYLRMISENVPEAKKIINSLIANYNREWDKDKDTVAKSTENYISKVLESTIGSLSKADMDIRNFKEKYNLTDIEADVKYYFAASGELQPTILEVTSQLKMIEIITDFVQDENNKYAMIPYNVSANNETLMQVTSDYNGILSQRNDMYSAAEQNKGIAKTLDAQIEAQRNVLIQSLDNFKKGLEITLNNLKNKEKEFTSKLGDIPEIEKDFIQLKREQEIQQAVYVLLLEMQIETGVKGVSILPKLKVIDEPYAELKPVEPNLLKVGLSTLLFGGILLPLSVIYGFPLIRTNMKRRKKR